MKTVSYTDNNKIIMRIIILLALGITFFACGEEKDNKGRVLDTPTTGSIKIMVDEGYKPIIETSIDVFDSVYSRSKITAIYTSEAEAVQALIRDSIQVIVITRTLTPEELSFFQARGFTPKITPIAHEAVAFLVNPANKDTAFTIAQMRDIMSGKVTKWRQHNPKNGLGDIRVVFDNALSGTVRYVKDSLCGGGDLTPNASALKSNEEVIKYVAKSKNAIGIISSNWVSDTDDKGVQKFRSEIKMADIAKVAGEEAWGPYQAYLATGYYPFRRTVYIINAQARPGLGLGFASFLAGSDGQRIVLKDGLLPAAIPPRVVKPSRE